jgi:hypothetical protein
MEHMTKHARRASSRRALPLIGTSLSVIWVEEPGTNEEQHGEELSDKKASSDYTKTDKLRDC